VIAGSWLIASVNIVRTTQRRSATCAVCGKRSLTHRPARPYWRKPVNDPAIGRIAWLPLMPVSRWPPRTDFGRSSPWRCCSSGFGSNVSNGEGPPAWNR
jgi:hypothetical protein